MKINSKVVTRLTMYGLIPTIVGLAVPIILSSEVKANMGACISAADRAELSNSRTREVCQNANSYTASCINTAAAADMSSYRITQTCDRATSGSVSCIRSAAASDMSDYRISQACGNLRETNVSNRDRFANCISEYMSRGLSEQSAVEVCRQ